jgi:predicted DNA-binding transcriptional regulator YafY
VNAVSEPSATFKLFHRAILERKQVTCTYSGHYREICPHVLGHKDGEEKLLAFQFAGKTSTKLPPAGEWRCFKVMDIRDAATRDGRWYSGSQHRSASKCVDEVYIDVNTDVPNQPGRR